MKPGRPPTAKTVKDYFSSGSGRKLWKEGKAEKENVGNGLGEFDDGKYRVKLVKAYTAMSNTSGRPQNVFGFKFVDGEYKGQTKFHYQGLDNKTGIAIALAALAKLGQDVESPDDIDDADKALQKKQPEVEIRLRTNGEYQNVIIMSVLSDSNDEEEEDVDVEEEVAPSKSKAVDNDDDDEDSEDDEDADGDEEADEDAEDGDKEGSEDADEDEDDEEEKTPSKKPAKKSKESDDEDEDEEDEEDEEDSDDDEKDDEDEEEVALEPGMKLKVKHEGETVKAKILKVLEKTREVRVKLADGSKITISVDDIIDVL